MRNYSSLDMTNIQEMFTIRQFHEEQLQEDKDREKQMIKSTSPHPL